ncbi:MAG: right-handed parallel beta-helix repeat-containing protein [Spirochaetes bacterium]|nr:right-handed parallel beta-helix repeat-containing protein [Spirochaetota bacterium]
MKTKTPTHRSSVDSFSASLPTSTSKSKSSPPFPWLSAKGRGLGGWVLLLSLSLLPAAELTVEDFSAPGSWRRVGGNREPAWKIERGELAVDMVYRNDERDMFNMVRGFDLGVAGMKLLRMKALIPKGSFLTVEWNLDGKLLRPISYQAGKGEWETLTFSVPEGAQKLSSFGLSFGEGGDTKTGDGLRTTRIGRIWLTDVSLSSGPVPVSTPELYAVPEPVLVDAAKAAHRFYLSPSGNDAWSGLSPLEGGKGGPWKTLARARQAVRDLKKSGGLKGPVNIELAAGTYELAETFTLGAEDSGTKEAPILYTAKKGAEARILGGRVVRDFKPVQGAALQKIDPAARGKVLVADLKAQGITRYGELKNGPSWGNSDTGMELFFGEKPMTLARYPNAAKTAGGDPWMRIAEVTVDDGHNIHGQRGSKVGQFTVKDGRIAKWVGEPQVMLSGYWFWDWADQRFMVSNIDAATKTITLSNANHPYGFRRNQWFYAYNLLCELDEPGEWYADRERGLLYFWPPSPLEGGVAMVSILSNLIVLENASNIEFRFLTLESCQDTALVARQGAELRLAGCTLRNTGSYGLSLEGRNLAVLGCDLYQLGDGGMQVSGGDRKTLTPGGNLVENCHIHHYGRWDAMYKGGIHLNGVGNSARRNLIHDGPHTAIFWAGNELVMELNEIHSVVYESGDAGAIYAGRDWTMRGVKVRNNYFHHIYGFEGRGANGVYFDDQYSSAEMVGNILWKVPKALLLGGGRDNLVANNLFLECDKAVHIDARGLGWAAGGKDGLIGKLNAMPFRAEPWKSRYPQLLTLLDDEPMAPKGNFVDKNITWKCEGNSIEGKAAPYVVWGSNLVEVDPRFEDEKAGNFNLKADSPAWAMGWKRIPTEKIGVYADAWRATWPVKNEVRAGKLTVGQANPHPAKPETIPAVKSAPVIDGNINDNEWRGMKTLSLAETPNRDSVKRPCTAKIGHLGNRLFIALFIPVTNTAALKKDPKWGSSDGVEVCFRLHEGIDYRPGPTFIVQGFPGGDKLGNVQGRAAEDSGRKVAAASAVAAKIVDGGWTLEYEIPLDAAGIAAAPGMKLGFNIGVRRTESNEWIAFGGTLGANHNLGNARILILE